MVSRISYLHPPDVVYENAELSLLRTISVFGRFYGNTCLGATLSPTLLDGLSGF